MRWAPGYELRVIASTVIGGANLMGGEGGAFGAFIGAALIEVIRNSLLMAGIDTNWQGSFVGVFIVFAVLLQADPRKSGRLSASAPVRAQAAVTCKRRYTPCLGKLLGATVAAAAILAMSQGADAQPKKYVFALVPKNMNNPFFDQARDGCKKAEKELGGAIECLYIGPGEHGGGDEQVQVVNDLIAKKVDGIAVSPSNAAAMGKALEGAKAAGIPVLTWDSDLLPRRTRPCALAYVGTHNYEIGVNLAKLAQKIKPKGGTICIQSGGAAAANHNERMQGIRDTLAGRQERAVARRPS